MYTYYFSLIPEVFQSGVWATLQELDNPKLVKLARRLPATVLQSRAQSSTRKYLGGFKRWKVWAQQHKLAVFPVEGAKLALYLQHLRDRLESKAAVEEAVNSLAWVHSLAIQPPSGTGYT